MLGSLDQESGRVGRSSSQRHPRPRAGRRPSSTCMAQCCPALPASSSPLAAPERPAGRAERPHPGSRHSAPAGYSQRGARSAACPARATARQCEAAPRAQLGGPTETPARQPQPLATRALKRGPGAAVRAARRPLTSGSPLLPLPR